VAAPLFLSLLRLLPRAPGDVAGPRVARTVDMPVPPITGSGTESGDPEPVAVENGG